MDSVFNVPFVLHGDALVILVSQTFQLTLAEARDYFDKSGRNVAYCGYSSNHTWRPVSLAEGVPLEGGTLRVGGRRHLTLPERLVRVKTERNARYADRITVTVVEMREVQ